MLWIKTSLEIRWVERILFFCFKIFSKNFESRQVFEIYIFRKKRVIFQIISNNGINKYKSSEWSKLASHTFKWMFCTIISIIIVSMKKLFEGALPQDWKSAQSRTISPIYKKGPKDLLENYRPVSLTSISWALGTQMIVFFLILNQECLKEVATLSFILFSA